MLEVRERPIICTGEMVPALLREEGPKTQTRRVIKPQPEYEGLKTYGDSWAWRQSKDVWFSGVTTAQMVGAKGLPLHCPYGQPGDLLWVRETFYCDDYRYPGGPIEELLEEMYYRADGEPEFECCGGRFWKPSIHMPKWAARLWLCITDVRVERVQDISEADAVAEGVDHVSLAEVPRQASWSRRQDFSRLWDSINAKRGYGWDSNPWVWVIRFERVERA